MIGHGLTIFKSFLQQNFRTKQAQIFAIFGGHIEKTILRYV